MIVVNKKMPLTSGKQETESRHGRGESKDDWQEFNPQPRVAAVPGQPWQRLWRSLFVEGTIVTEEEVEGILSVAIYEIV